jgi:lipid-A-disaccharide synthase
VKIKSIMLIAGEASGDTLAGELVSALRRQLPDAKFFGAGGPKMAATGVELAFDLTQHSVIGISWLNKYFELRGLFNQLVQLAIERKPDVIIGVDYNLFNLRFAHAIQEHVRNNPALNWNPKLVKYISPQVWASREGRVHHIARVYDLVLSIFPFEKDWYANRVPNLRVEFVGHPMVDRYAGFATDDLRFTSASVGDSSIVNRQSQILLLPGSRVGELKRHLPGMLDAAKQISAKQPVQFKMILPDEKLKQLAVTTSTLVPGLEIQIGGLAESLSKATLAIASTGTVTMECAYFGVPTIAIYKTSWSTYQIGKRIVRVKYLAMPNLLANEAVFPEFIQNDATSENISRAAIGLLNQPERRAEIKEKLKGIVESLGKPGASERAARAILNL